MNARKSVVRFDSATRALLAQVASVADEPVWLVGGTIRDAALGRAIIDIDLACSNAHGLAALLARTLRATLITLDEKNAVYRLALPAAHIRAANESAPKQIDVAGLQGKSILEDIQRRDFTVNAVALELGKKLPSTLPETAFLDPRGGLKDLKAGLIRADIERNLRDDPLRLLRAFRLAAQLKLTIEPKTLKAIKRHRLLIKEPAPERIHAELLALLSVPGASVWLRHLDKHGLLTEIFPELKPARRCAVSYYGPGGVLAHTLEVCARVDFLFTNLRKIYPRLAPDLESHIVARGGPAFRALLILSALLHDVAKPETARRIGGRLRFFEHDTRGAAVTEKILRRLRLSGEQIGTAAAITRHHLRPGHLASGGPLTERAIYRFFRDLGEDAPGLLLVCWGDHASYMPETLLKRHLKTATADPRRCGASRLPEETQKTLRHLQLVSALLRRWRKRVNAPAPERLLDGRDIMKALKIPPGPKVGELIERVREAQAEGTVRDRQEALDLITRLA